MKSLTKKIMIIDDSIVIQKILKLSIESSPDYEVVSVCNDPFEASQKLSQQDIDLIILDLELPKMDGVTFLKKLREKSNIKILVLSSVINSKPEFRQKLISLGASEALPKPDQHINVFSKKLIQTIEDIFVDPGQQIKPAEFKTNDSVVLIASSTGSTDSIKKIVQSLNSSSFPVIVIQHMAADFTKKFAHSLNQVSRFKVVEIQDQMILENNTVYVAPGNYHISLNFKKNAYYFETHQDNPIHGVRPAADYTFLRWPKTLSKNTKVIILSGMGKDGASGLAHLHKQGAYTVAESEKTSVVFGMPKAAIDTGEVDLVLDLDKIIEFASTPDYVTKKAG